MDWDKLRIFHAVADAGSLTHAGDTLHLSQSAVSRQIRALEESLDTTLFRRHARGLLLTEQGELLFEATRSMTKRLEATAARIRDSEDEVFGELRVTTTTGFGTLWLAPRLQPALRALPEPEDRPDARGTHPRPADARGGRGDPDEGAEPGRADPPAADGGAHPALRLAATTWREHGLPTTPEELAGHRIITQSPTSPQVRAGADFVQPFLAKAPASSLTVNNYFGILQGVIHGLGIGSLPDYLTADFPDLVHVLPEEKSAPIPTYLAYVEELRHSKRVCAFRDFVVEEISAYKRGEQLGSAGAPSHAASP